MDSFFILLPSNTLQTNTLSNFMTHLPRTIELVGKWEVALVEIQYSLTWPNVSEKDTEVVVIKNNDIKKYRLMPMHYDSIYVLVQAIEQLTKQRILFTKGRVGVKQGDTALHLSPKISYMLGYDDTNIQNSKLVKQDGDDVYSVAAHPPDMTGGLNSLYVYCSIVAPQITGNTESPLLRNVGVKGSFGDYVSREYTNPHYVPVIQKIFDRIEINIKDDSGKDIQFEYGKVVLKLHFRQNED